MPKPPLRSLLGLAAAATLLASCASLDGPPPATSITPMPDLGHSTFQVTARDESARAWFAQGLQLAYAFEHREAARVFRAPLARHPSCAICLNPLFSLLAMFQRPIYDGMLPTPTETVAAIGVAVGSLALGLFVFRRCEDGLIFRL